MTTLELWNELWGRDGSVVQLVPYALNPKLGLEGASVYDRELIRRTWCSGVIKTEKQYNELVQILSDWGYCVETPADWEFKEA